MDILGKQGEEASERLTAVEERIQKLDSHLNAVDNALQDFVDNYSRILEEELDYQGEEILQLREIVHQNVAEEEKIKVLEDRINSLESRLERQEEQLEQVMGSELENTLSDLIEGISNVKSTMNGLKGDVEGLEQRVDDIESELMVEINNRDFDFDKKLDRRDFEDREEELEEEIRKLRTSVNILADELDKKDEIEVE